jgi:hypothetical protein
VEEGAQVSAVAAVAGVVVAAAAAAEAVRMESVMIRI